MPYKDKEKQKKAQHESYLRNKEILMKRQRNRRREVRQWLWDYKRDKECILCGEKRRPALVFHHRDPSKKEHSIQKLCTDRKSKEMILKEIEKCDIICANCHNIIHHESRNDIVLVD